MFVQKLFKTFPFVNQQPYATISTKVRRALLYVPGDDQRKLHKAINLNVDCLILDCEDGVALNKKDIARSTISKFLLTNDIKNNNNQIELSVRVNSIESGLLENDLKIIYGIKNYPKTLFLPKINKLKDFGYFSEYLKKYLFDQTIKINIFFYAESCETIMNLPDICQRAIDLSKFNPFNLTGIVFGSDDFCASLGASRTSNSLEILYARQRVVLVAKAFNLQAIDMVHIDLNDDDGLKRTSEEGASFGYTGKQVIHPKQVEIVQNAFLPSDDKIQWAKELLDEYKCFQESGKGAFNFKGKMIDAPTVKQAENILNIYNSIINRKSEDKIN